MGWAKDHKAQTREKIVRSAAQLFTQLGYEAVGIDSVMQAARLTRGAFYSHFKSKSDLYAQAITGAAALARTRVMACLPPKPSLAAIAACYLNPAHLSRDDGGCPLAFLTTDIYQREEPVRSAYTNVFKGFINALAESQPSADRQQIMHAAVLMIGGLAIARALNDDDLSAELLQVCQQSVARAATTA